MNGRVLIIAGSDSGGGAGIQADLKTVTALDGFAMTAITALTAQNTQGVQGVFDVPEDFIQHQIKVVLSDIGADAIKIGMLHRASVIHAVADVLESFDLNVPLVLDPVMIAKGGHALLEPDALQAMKDRLFPKAVLITPNIPEAEALSGLNINGLGDYERVAETMAKEGDVSILIKGGHAVGDLVVDMLWQRGAPIINFESARIDSRHTHGTGCTLASAIACGLAQGLSLVSSIDRARAYVWQAIQSAPGYGQGHGPLNHAHTVKKFP